MLLKISIIKITLNILSQQTFSYKELIETSFFIKTIPCLFAHITKLMIQDINVTLSCFIEYVNKKYETLSESRILDL